MSRTLILPVMAVVLFIAACAAPARAPSKNPPMQTTGHRLTIGGLPFGKADILSSKADIDERETPVVNVEFTLTGQQKFRQAMQKVGLGQPMPVRVDERDVASPILQDLDIKDRVTIAGLSSSEEAATIAAAIASASGPEDQ